MIIGELVIKTRRRVGLCMGWVACTLVRILDRRVREVSLTGKNKFP